MNIHVAYNEITEQIARKFMVRPVFTAVDEKTVEVSYKPVGFLPTISVRFHIEAMRKDIVCMTYDCAPATAMIISGLVAQLGKSIPGGLEIKTTEKRVNIYLQRFEKAEKMLEYLALSDIIFEQDAVNVKMAVCL